MADETIGSDRAASEAGKANLLADPVLPPILTAHAVDAARDVFAAAVAGARDGSYGAADCLWSRRTARAEFALVLEPDVPARRARQMGPLAFTAIADSLGSTMPPKTSVLLRWPGTILVNGAAAGEIRLAMADVVSPDVPPEWLVVGASIRLTRAPGRREPGEEPDVTVLFEEGGGDLDRTAVLQSAVAHVLAWLARWQDDGFACVHESFIGRVEGHETPAVIQSPEGPIVDARVIALTEDCELLVKDADGRHRAVPFWTARVEGGA